MKKIFHIALFFVAFVFFSSLFTRNAFAAFSTIPANPNENTQSVTIKWTGVPNGNHKICLNQEFCDVPIDVTASGGIVSLSVCGFNDKIIECDGNTHWFHGNFTHNAYLKINSGSQTLPGEFVVDPWIVLSQFKPLPNSEFLVNLSGCRYPKTETNRNDYHLFFHKVGDTDTPSGFSDKFDVDPATCKGSKRFGPLVDGDYSFTIETDGDNIVQAEYTFTLEEGKVTKSEKVSGGGGSGTPGENPCGAPGGDCDTAIGLISSNGTEFISKVLTISLGIAGAIALILMVIGSIRVLASSGDQQRLNGGREMIIAAVAGLLFIVFSILILQFIDAKLINVGFK